MLATSVDVLRFWFGDEVADRNAMNNVEYIHSRSGYWFMRKSPEFEATQLASEKLILDLRSNTSSFTDSEVVVTSTDSDWHVWDTTPQGLLAKVIVFDQFPRTVYRGTPEAFGFDGLAVAAAKRLVSAEFLDGYNSLAPIQKMFVVVCLQHSESLENQDLGMALVSRVTENETDGGVIKHFEDFKWFWNQHFDCIKRFGRFPSRNDALVSRIVKFHDISR